FVYSDVRCTHLAYRSAYNDVRLSIGEDRRVLRLPFMVAIQRLHWRRTADHFHTPWFDWPWRRCDRLTLRHGGGRWIAWDDSARRRCKQPGWCACPFFDGAACYNLHIRSRFLRQWPPPSKPIANTPRARIVRGCRQAEIAEFIAKIT